MTNHDQLEEALAKIRYPEGIVPCFGKYCAINGQSFFPGGRGHIGPDLPVGGIMYLGHNFDKVSGFQASVHRGIEENLTWRSIRTAVLPVLSERAIWFTNYFIGLQDGPTNVGKLPRNKGFADYEEDCWNFFLLQVSLQQPKIIAVLGREPVSVLCPTNRLNVKPWIGSEKKAFGDLRFVKHPSSISYKGTRHNFDLVAIYHPAYGRSDKQISEILADSKYLAR